MEISSALPTSPKLEVTVLEPAPYSSSGSLMSRPVSPQRMMEEALPCQVSFHHWPGHPKGLAGSEPGPGHPEGLAGSEPEARERVGSEWAAQARFAPPGPRPPFSILLWALGS